MSAKLPIPRLRRERRENVSRRVSRACEHCRKRKVKCDGSGPACSQCGSQGPSSCFYSERKAVRQQIELRSMQKEIDSYRELLEDISQGIEGPIANRVAMALKRPEQAKRDELVERPFSPSLSSVPLKQVDVDEDFNRSDNNTESGYVGNTSGVASVQQLGFQASKRSDEEMTPSSSSRLQFPIESSITSMDYHCEHQAKSGQGVIDAFVLPPKTLADRLFRVYFEKAHISLPIVQPDLVLEQYSYCYSGVQSPNRKWLAVLNMILAIACSLSRVFVLEMPQGADENLFSARARSLSFSDDVPCGHNDLQQVQAETLMAFYFLIQSQINRSWKMIGIASRSGIALGLNLEKRISGLDMRSGEARKQLWWSIFRLEHVLSVMTGRFSFIGNSSYSASPPSLSPVLDLTAPGIAQSIDELRWTIHTGEERMDPRRTLLKSLAPTTSLYFFYIVDLSLIVHNAMNELYGIDSSRAGWGRVESGVAFYGKKVDYWATTIHPSFCIQGGHSNPLLRRSPFHLSLALNYYSAYIVLRRPYLNSPALKKQNGSRYSGGVFTNTGAFSCLRASLAVIALLPDQPDLAWYYRVSCWWDFLHILTQAIVVLLFHIPFGPVSKRLEEIPYPIDSADPVWAGVQKGLSWLHCLGRSSEVARRAFHCFKSCAHQMAPSKDLKLQGTPSTIESSQASCDSNCPWFRDSSEKQWDIEDAMLSQGSHGVPYCLTSSASAIPVTDVKVSELIWRPDVAIEEILFAIMDVSAYS